MSKSFNKYLADVEYREHFAWALRLYLVVQLDCGQQYL